MKKNVVKVQNPMGNSSNKRRSFLKLSGMALAGTGLLVACSNDDDGGMTDGDGDVFDLGSGDLGILNYAYALEQLEADFYTKVVNGSYWSGAADDEKNVLLDLYNHEVNHRDFFSAAISANFSMEQKLPTLEFDYGDLNFNDRASVLNTAKALEDTGVAAYNGAGQYIQNADYLVIAGKIVSVEARHAAAIRMILSPDTSSFAGDDVVDNNGLDKAMKPSDIIAAVTQLGFIKTPFTANNLQ